MKKILTNQKWKFVSSCMCGGKLREKYKNDLYPGYEVRIRPTMGIFSIIKKGLIVIGPEYGYKLEQKLKDQNIYAA